jgi:hypothetical protein
LLDSLACVGIYIDVDYRIIYDATKKTAEDDVSLMPLRDELGEPYIRTTAAATTPPSTT